MSLLLRIQLHYRHRHTTKKTFLVVLCLIFDGCCGFLASHRYNAFLETHTLLSVPSCGCTSKKRRRSRKQGFEISIGHQEFVPCERSRTNLICRVRHQNLRLDTSLTILRLSNENVDFRQSQPPKEPVSMHILKPQILKLLTIKELKELLRQCGAKVSGNKQELVDRLVHELHMAAAGHSPFDATSCNEILDSTEGHETHLEGIERSTSISNVPLLEEDQSAGWYVLEPSISLLTSSSDEKNDPSEFFDGGVEYPFVSGLLFVNKPSGMSTLPTKQQLLQNASVPLRNGNGNTPIYPCLSDAVKLWLQSNPDGKKRMKHARQEEEKWWNVLIRSQKHLDKPHSKHNPPTVKHRQWKKTKQLLKQLKSKTSSFEPRPVHRLDIDTSGIVCIALTPYALRAANMLFERKSRLGYQSNTTNDDFDQKVSKNIDENIVKKKYVALVEGSIAKEKSSGLVSHAIGKVWVQDGDRDTGGHHEWACDILDDGTLAFCRPGDDNLCALQGSFTPLEFAPGTLREAITTYQAIEWSNIGYDSKAVDITRVELTPHTGRGHQLRLHMAALGHPILGDDMHGRNGVEKSVDLDSLDRNELFLHASKLSLVGWCLENNESDAVKKCRIDVDSVPPF